MEEPEFKERLKALELKHKKEIQNLQIDFAMSNAKYKEGDIIADSVRTIKVDKITVYVSYGVPEPVYHGYDLKKDLTPKKNNSRESIYGNRSVTLIKSAD